MNPATVKSFPGLGAAPGRLVSVASLLLTPTAFLFCLPHGCCWWEVLIHASDLPGPGAPRQPGRAELLPQVLKQALSRPQGSEWSQGRLHQQGIFPQEFKVLWYAWMYQDIWLLKLVYNRQYAPCISVAISLLSTGDFVWGMFSHNTEVHFKNTLFCRLSLMTIFLHTSIKQQHMPAFLP